MLMASSLQFDHTREGAKRCLDNTCTIAAYMCMPHLVYKSHFWGEFLVQKNATYTRINTVDLMQGFAAGNIWALSKSKTSYLG